MEAMVRLVDGMQFVGETGTGFSMVIDAARPVGGRDSGPRPYELFLVGMAGCTAMDVISILRKKRADVTAFEVWVDGEQAGEHPKILTDITVHYKVFGRNIKEKDVKRAIDLSEETYCPAQTTMKASAKISHSFEIIEVDDAENQQK